ncbi:MAG: hypothetical protein Q9O62_10285 [Ardenticatenia bacterium]|nr:hypothetical protein [Ardenticatenia bacterium]
MARVLTTQEALQQLQQMETIINGELRNEVSKLEQLIQRLSDPNVWAGGAATRRSQAESWRGNIKNALQRVQELQDVAETVNARIREAGGGLA